MNEIKIKATRAKLMASLQDSDISRRIDKMDLYQTYNYILLHDAKEAAKDERYKRAKTFVKCKVYVTASAGTYGHQFLAAIWCNAEGQWWQASGSMTGGCGYDKISTAIENAFDSLGIGGMIDHFGGTGLHEKALEALAAKLAGRKAWLTV